jgi:outer membrane protein OmpA-like peptidoglycan-associated protein
MIRKNILVLFVSLVIGFAGSTVLGQIEIDDEGIRMPGVEVDSGGTVRLPGVTIDGGGVHNPRCDCQKRPIIKKSCRQTRDFSGQDLSEALFESTDIRSADFSNANLKGAIFRTSDVRTADFRGACLVNAQFLVSDLRNADFTGAILIETKFSVSDMSGAHTRGAIYEGPAVCPGEQSGSRPDLMKADKIRQALSQSKGKKVDLTVNFETDSSKIKSEGHVQIFEIANALRSEELKNARIRIEGHTDNVGSDTYNLDLSYRRAIAVVRVLAEEYNFSTDSFEVKGFGEEQPVSSNDNPDGRALNRRVTLVNLGRKRYPGKSLTFIDSIKCHSRGLNRESSFHWFGYP